MPCSISFVYCVVYFPCHMLVGLDFFPCTPPEFGFSEEIKWSWCLSTVCAQQLAFSSYPDLRGQLIRTIFFLFFFLILSSLQISVTGRRCEHLFFQQRVKVRTHSASKATVLMTNVTVVSNHGKFRMYLFLTVK